MLELILWGSAIAVTVGVALGLYVHFSDSGIKIPPWEYAACGLVLLLALVPLTSFVGYELSISNNTTYYEFWNGYEYSTHPVVYQCSESDEDGGSTGGCRHYYDCDSYQVTVDDPDTTDDQGHVHHHSHKETRYRQCPYTTTEISWIISTTVGDFNVGDHWLPPNPEQHRLQPENDWARSLPNLPAGVPQAWTDAQGRIQQGQPAPVSALKSYTNYILASQNSLLVAHSSDIDRFRKAGLLPDLSHEVHGVYFIDRAYFVGVKVADPTAWQWQLDKLNSALGATEQGNLYVVVVDSGKVSRDESMAYLLALTAYWESPSFGKYAISKNGIVVVLGTKDGKTVDWAKAATGMPKGNEFMLGDIENRLPGATLDPRALFGDPDVHLPIAQNSDGSFTVAIEHHQPQGVLEDILWGSNHFERVHMGFYSYLRGDLTLSTGQTVLVLFTVFLISLAAWGFICYHAVPAYNRYRSNR